jgi:hypothetical protein
MKIGNVSLFLAVQFKINEFKFFRHVTDGRRISGSGSPGSKRRG